MSRPTRIRPPTAAALLVCLLGCAALIPAAPPGRTPAAAPCTGRSIASWSADPAMTGEFARYGNDNTRTDDWTGGDGTHTVRLPDGRTLWLFSDTFLDRVHPPDPAHGAPHPRRTSDTGTTPLLRHNSAVVMSRSGRLERTLTGGTPQAPGPFFPDQPGAWRWPVRALVEPRTPGAAEKVVRVLLWNRALGSGPWVFGVPRATEVATLSLPDLRLESITETVGQTSVADPGRRVLYGAGAVRDGRWTYVFGADDPPGTNASSAYLARVPAGRLADRAAWRYWDGERWQRAAGRAAPVLRGTGRRGVGSAFSVLRDGRGWLLFTMDTGAGGGAALTSLTTYWSCSPHGPWHGPRGRIALPRPPGADPRHTVVYNPQAHPEFTGTGGLLLSYDVNWLGPPGTTPDSRLNGDVDLYRPRFLRLRLGPAPS